MKAEFRKCQKPAKITVFEHARNPQLDFSAFKKQDTKLLCTWNKDLFSISFPGEKYNNNKLKEMLKKPGEILILELNKKPIGFLWLKVKENKGHIKKLYIAKEFRGRGLGKLLIKKSFGYFKKKKVKKIDLVVTKSNKKAVNLYIKSGFKIKRYVMEKKS